MWYTQIDLPDKRQLDQGKKKKTESVLTRTKRARIFQNENAKVNEASFGSVSVVTFARDITLEVRGLAEDTDSSCADDLAKPFVIIDPDCSLDTTSSPAV